MNLIYILILFSGPTWQGSTEIYSTPSQERCEAISAQLKSTGSRYECHTLVTSGAKP